MDATGSGRFTYLYDLAGQITSLRNPYSERTTFAYDDAGRRIVQRNGNGTRVSMAYDAASQTTQVIHRKSHGTSLLQLDYKYDSGSVVQCGSSLVAGWIESVLLCQECHVNAD